MSDPDRRLPGPANETPVERFVAQAQAVAAREAQVSGRLIFALDATMSRQPTWDLAQAHQSRMFEAAARFGGLAVQLVYFRGLGECRASAFVSGGAGLAALMSKISVRGGHTQIGRVLAHTREEAARRRVGALVYVGDAMEENADALAVQAGQLALAGVKGFMFQEGRDAATEACFRDIARITGGAFAAFDANAGDRLAALLAAAAAYAAGGHKALADQAGRDNRARLLLEQMRSA